MIFIKIPPVHASLPTSAKRLVGIGARIALDFPQVFACQCADGKVANERNNSRGGVTQL
jgi:hypothetical protein